MKEPNRNYTAVGAFVLSMLALLLIWISVLSGAATSRDRYYILWDNVMGLKPGTQILFEGYTIGLIDEISRSEGTASGGKNYRVDIEVEKGWPIPDSALAVTTAPSFLAALVVNIDGGESMTLLQPESEIPGKEQGDLLSAAGDVMATLTETLEFMKPKLESITDSVSRILSEENADQIQAMLQTLNDRIEDLLSAENADRVETILVNMSATSKNMSDLTGSLRESKAAVDDVLKKIDELVDQSSGDLGNSLVYLHASLATVARHIDAIANHLETTTRNFSEFSSQIREDPSVLLRGRNSSGDGAGAK